MPETPPNNADHAQKRKKERELTNSSRKAVVVTLNSMVENGHLPHGALTEVGRKFSVSRQTIKNIWTDYSPVVGIALNMPSSSFSRRNQRGNKKLYLADDQFIDAVRNIIPINKRRTIRDLAAALGLSKATVYRMMQEKVLRRHSSSLKPALTEEHKLARLAWCWDHVDPTTNLFCNMEDVIHVDEKWFNQMGVSMSCILTADKDMPTRTTRHKSHIPKVMFIAAVARPRCYYDENNTIHFWDGKLGIFECVRMVPAQRNSRNRPAGTPVPKAYTVNQQTYKAFMLNQLLPAIKEKCPLPMLQKTIYIQQDNATPHVPMLERFYPEFVARCQELEIDVKIREQPAQSPDLNVLDLALFRALQQRKEAEGTPNNIVEIVELVKKLMPSTHRRASTMPS